MSGRKKRLTAVVGGALLVAFALLFVAANRVQPEPSLHTQKIGTGRIERRVTATGKVELVNKVEVRAQLSSAVAQVFVDVGDTVKVGQVLATLRPDDLQIQLQQALAHLQVAKAQAKNNPTGSAAATMEHARAEFDRFSFLFSEGLITKQEIEDKKLEFQKATIDFHNSQAENERLQASIVEAEAAVDIIRRQLEKTVVTSPLAGVILSRSALPGLVTASDLNPTPLFVIGGISSARFRGQVDESEVGLLRPKLSAEIRVEELPDRVLKGHVELIYPAGVERENFTRQEIRIALDEEVPTLRDQTTAKAEIVVARKEKALIIPEAWLRWDGEKPYLEVVLSKGKKQEIRKAEVTLGISDGVNVEIVRGITAGDDVLTSAP